VTVHLDPAWVAAIVSALALILAARPLRWAFRLLIATHEFLTDWPKMKMAIADLQHEVAAVKAETRPNGGNSLRDVVHRTAADVADIKDEQSRLRTLVELRHPPERT
jgi:hypothetical protein